MAVLNNLSFEVVDGDVLASGWLNQAAQSLPPIGGSMWWDDDFGQKETGSVTSVVASELNDTAATFVTNSVAVDDVVRMVSNADTTSLGPVSNGTFTVVTVSFVAAGVLVDSCSFETDFVQGGAGNGVSSQEYTYADVTTQTVSTTFTASTGGFITRTLSNPQPGKKVTSIAFKIQTFNASDTITGRNLTTFFLETTQVASVASETRLTLDDDIFNIVGMTYRVTKTPVLTARWEIEDGSTVSNASSPMVGETHRDKTGNNYFIRSAGSSGNTGNVSDSNATNQFIDMVPIKRVL